MKIINAEWTPKVNMLVIKCKCNNKFYHKADRIKIKCPKCGKIGNCFDVKNNGVHFERKIKTK